MPGKYFNRRPQSPLRGDALVLRQGAYRQDYRQRKRYPPVSEPSIPVPCPAYNGPGYSPHASQYQQGYGPMTRYPGDFFDPRLPPRPHPLEYPDFDMEWETYDPDKRVVTLNFPAIERSIAKNAGTCDRGICANLMERKYAERKTLSIEQIFRVRIEPRNSNGHNIWRAVLYGWDFRAERYCYVITGEYRRNVKDALKHLLELSGKLKDMKVGGR